MTLASIGQKVFFRKNFLELLLQEDLFKRTESPPASGPIRTSRIPVERALERGDPTGCGDVFGGTLVGQLLWGVDIEAAVRKANALARRNLTLRGATNLHYHLRGEIAPI